MKLPQIRLQSEFAQITIQTRPSTVSIEQPQADLQLQQPSAELTINRTPSRLTIDQTEAWHAMDLKSPFVRTRDAAQQGKQDVMAGIQRRIQEGAELMMIENGGNPIPSMAKRNGTPPPDPIGIAFIPPHFSVKTDYTPSEIDISWQTNRPINETKANAPIISMEAGDVEITPERYASLSIDFVNIDQKA